MRYAIVTAALLAGLTWVLFVAAIGDRGAERRAPVREASRAMVIAVLGDDVDGRSGRLRGSHAARVVKISLPDGRVEARRALGPRLGSARLGAPGAAELSFPGQLLAAGEDGRTVYALARQGRHDYVEVLEATSLKPRRRYPLARGIDYSGFTLGRSGRIHAFGARRLAAGHSVPMLTVLGPDGEMVATRSVPGRTGRDWAVHAGALTADEQRLILTYHGANTTGADWIDVGSGGLRRCEVRDPDRACLFEIHGDVEPYGDGFLATTGSRVVAISREGRLVKRLPLVPENVHLMNFALHRSDLYVASCGSKPAIHRLDLATGRVETMRSGRFCGAALAAGAGVLVTSADTVRHGHAEDAPRLRLIALADPGAGLAIRHRGRPLDAIILAPGADHDRLPTHAISVPQFALRARAWR